MTGENESSVHWCWDCEGDMEPEWGDDRQPRCPECERVLTAL